jgi:hypothetical protein
MSKPARKAKPKSVMGRPTDYGDATVAAARAYMSAAIVPTIAGLAVDLDITRETVYAWAADPEKVDFSDIVEKIRTKQEARLLEGGLLGTLNSTITALMLARHGWVKSVELKGDPNAPLGLKHSGQIDVAQLTPEEASKRYWAELKQVGG